MNIFLVFPFIFDRGSVFPLSSMSKGEKERYCCRVVKVSKCRKLPSMSKGEIVGEFFLWCVFKFVIDVNWRWMRAGRNG